MARNIFILAVVLVVGFFIYKYVAKPRISNGSMANGDITCQGCLSPEQKARFDKENQGEDADGQSEHKTTHGNISADAAPTAPAPAASTDSKTVASTTAAATPSTTAIPGSPVVEPAPAPSATTYPAPVATTPVNAAQTSLGAPPTGDTIAPNPPNGMVFSGKGTYQWYRQGNITWRVDTVTGRSCIVFATDEEWRKPRVLSHGCGRSA